MTTGRPWPLGRRDGTRRLSVRRPPAAAWAASPRQVGGKSTASSRAHLQNMATTHRGTCASTTGGISVHTAQRAKAHSSGEAGAAGLRWLWELVADCQPLPSPLLRTVPGAMTSAPRNRVAEAGGSSSDNDSARSYPGSAGPTASHHARRTPPSALVRGYLILILQAEQIGGGVRLVQVEAGGAVRERDR